MEKYLTFAGKRFIKKVAKGENYRKVRDHYDYTGKVRGAGHSLCNLRFYCLTKFLYFFTTGHTMIIILS